MLIEILKRVDSNSLQTFMLTCKRFSELVNTTRRLNSKLTFRIDYMKLNDHSNRRYKMLNSLIILKSNRKFEKVYVVGIRTASDLTHCAMIIQGFAEYVKDIYLCGRVNQELLSNFLGILPNLTKIHLHNITDDREINFEGPLPPFKFLKQLIANTALSVFQNATKLERVFAKTSSIR